MLVLMIKMTNRTFGVNTEIILYYFEISCAGVIQIVVFWVIAPRIIRNFGATFCLHPKMTKLGLPEEGCSRSLRNVRTNL